MRKELLKAIEQGYVKTFYKSTEWINKRKDIIKRDKKECQRCKANGGYHKAECVHHIKHLRDRPDLALTNSNLISLCYTCHNEVHPEKLHKNYKPKFKNKERW
ncbi:HNH endonuclease [Clostridium botulinum]|uniref:HNH endonuclease n=1 Tax=Clostridium botulinum TaxID=1491 RepID=UPI00059BD1FC|nr:HNH endonuclease [Clostridium botulinum]KIN79907.1 HNH endonuclease [Clostridium botulinum]MCC5425859.1 HNH endonuclease [Clostridium botulinum]